MAVNIVVVCEVFYLFNSRFFLKSVLSREGLTGNRYILFAVAACIPLQLAYTYLPIMQTIFNSASLSLLEWGKVLAAGLLLFLLAELEKFIIRRTGLGKRLGLQ